MKDSNGGWVIDREGKRKILQDFFSELYKREDGGGEQKIEQYIGMLGLPKLSEEVRQIFNKEITESDVRVAIEKQKTRKTPGIDGLPTEFYKKALDMVTKYMTEVFNGAFLDGRIPPSWTEAYISLIPKEGTDLSLIRNYRSISLLNTDYKIFTSILAGRMKGFLDHYIHSDQNGFLPHRQIRDILRMIINALEYYEAQSDKEAAFLEE